MDTTLALNAAVAGLATGLAVRMAWTAYSEWREQSRPRRR